jgi:diaminopimelate decarboxylase
MELINGRYHIDGVDVLKIVDEFDSPVYVYSAETMKAQFEKVE